VRTSFFHKKIFPRLRCRAERLDPVKKENTSPSGWQEPRGGEASLKLSSEWQADAETILQTMGFSSVGNFPSQRHYSLFA
jgi:hypothetical protein